MGHFIHLGACIRTHKLPVGVDDEVHLVQGDVVVDRGRIMPDQAGPVSRRHVHFSQSLLLAVVSFGLLVEIWLCVSQYLEWACDLGITFLVEKGINKRMWP